VFDEMFVRTFIAFKKKFFDEIDRLALEMNLSDFEGIVFLLVLLIISSFSIHEDESKLETMFRMCFILVIASCEC
jgi:hypothetical protein